MYLTGTATLFPYNAASLQQIRSLCCSYLTPLVFSVCKTFHSFSLKRGRWSMKLIFIPVLFLCLSFHNAWRQLAVWFGCRLCAGRLRVPTHWPFVLLVCAAHFSPSPLSFPPHTYTGRYTIYPKKSSALNHHLWLPIVCCVQLRRIPSPFICWSACFLLSWLKMC